MVKKSLFGRILIYFITVIVFSLSTVSFLIYWKSSQALDDQIKKYISNQIHQTSYLTDVYLSNYERVSTSIISEPSIKSFVQLKDGDIFGYINLNDTIKTQIFQPAFTIYPWIELIYVINENGKVVANDNQNNLVYNDFSIDKRQSYLWENTPDNGAVAILKPQWDEENAKHSITIARKIKGVSTYHPKGILAMEVKTDEIREIWNHVNLEGQGLFFILDQEGNWIYNSENNDHLISEATIQDFLTREEYSLETLINDEAYVLISHTSDYGWKLICGFPQMQMHEPISSVRNTAFVVGIVTLLIALWLSFSFAKGIIKPIRMLKDGMRQTEKGNWQPVFLRGREDEIGGLVHSYNLMVNRLSEMIEKVYEAELSNQRNEIKLQKIDLERQKAEFQSLQLQINPHFLYNTLETINCYAIVKDSEEITNIIEALAYMLRYSIQTNLEEVALVNELNHVRNFLIIQNHRIGFEFEPELKIHPDYLLDKMVRLTLQPLVENIFQHGFANGIEPHHQICISAERTEDQKFIVAIEDNGEGIAPSRLQEIRDHLEHPDGNRDDKGTLRRGGIGLVNVHRRIQMVYGSKYGIEIESELGKGTRIKMIMPLKTSCLPDH